MAIYSMILLTFCKREKYGDQKKETTIVMSGQKPVVSREDCLQSHEGTFELMKIFYIMIVVKGA